MFSQACTFKNLSQGQVFGPIELERLAEAFEKGNVARSRSTVYTWKVCFDKQVEAFFFRMISVSEVRLQLPLSTFRVLRNASSLLSDILMS